MSIFSVGLKKLRKIQLGQEVTPGNAVVATTMWRGPGTGIDDQRKVEFIEEDVGNIGGSDRTNIPELLAAISFDATPASFEQVLHLLEGGVKTVAPSQDGAGSDYISAYAMSEAAQNTIKTYTIEAGDNQQAEEMEHSFVDSFTLSGKTREALMMSANWIGRQATNTTFTGAISAPDVETINFTPFSLFIDATTGTIGTTQVSNTLLEMELAVKTGWMPVFTADGLGLYFSGIKIGVPEVTLKLVYEHNATAVTEKTAWRNQTPRQIRLFVEGSAVSMAGTTYSNKTLIIDLAGKYEKFDALGEQDGNDIVSCMFRSKPNDDASLFTTFTVVHELAAVP